MSLTKVLIGSAAAALLWEYGALKLEKYRSQNAEKLENERIEKEKQENSEKVKENVVESEIAHDDSTNESSSAPADFEKDLKELKESAEKFLDADVQSARRKELEKSILVIWKPSRGLTLVGNVLEKWSTYFGNRIGVLHVKTIEFLKNIYANARYYFNKFWELVHYYGVQFFGDLFEVLKNLTYPVVNIIHSPFCALDSYLTEIRGMPKEQKYRVLFLLTLAAAVVSVVIARNNVNFQKFKGFMSVVEDHVDYYGGVLILRTGRSVIRLV